MNSFFHRFHSPCRIAKFHVFKKQLTRITGFIMFLVLTAPATTCALLITPEQIESIAVYGPSIDQAHTLAPDQISYTITTPALIEQILQGIGFSQELDCSAIGSLPNAIVFIRFQDGNVARYQVVNMWSDFSAYGFSSCCFTVSPETQEILKANAQ